MPVYFRVAVGCACIWLVLFLGYVSFWWVDCIAESVFVSVAVEAFLLLLSMPIVVALVVGFVRNSRFASLGILLIAVTLVSCVRFGFLGWELKSRVGARVHLWIFENEYSRVVKNVRAEPGFKVAEDYTEAPGGVFFYFPGRSFFSTRGVLYRDERGGRIETLCESDMTHLYGRWYFFLRSR